MAHQIPHAAGRGRGRGDRISKLGDGMLGHILSFLPAQEAARAAALSTRWRNVYASVHTVSLEQPESPILRYGDDYSPGYGQFNAAVTAALLARHRRRPDSSGVVAARPLRALRVDMEDYRHGDESTVDHWVSYALKQAGPDLELDLRLRRAPICGRRYSLGSGGCCGGSGGGGSAAISPEEDDDDYADSEQNDESCGDGESLSPDSIPAEEEADVGGAISDGYSESDNSLCACSVEEYDDEDISPDDDDDVVSSEDERASSPLPRRLPLPEYNVPRGLFSCAVLRSLHIGPCRLSPPATISLPSLEALFLMRVSDDGVDVQRLISACPRLADLTLEACDMVTALSLLHTRLLRLTLRCCHRLANVAIDVSELRAFGYRGAVPNTSFLTICGSSSRPSSITSCKVDICGKEVSSEKELTKLNEFLHLFADMKHLHLQSARLGSGMDRVSSINSPVFSSLRHLEMRGCLPHEDATIVGSMSRILRHAPNLEAISLIFETGPELDDDDKWLPGGHYSCKERELLDAHHLNYNRFDVLDAPTTVIPCLRNRVREINLVHYQGGRGQRSLAKFLLCNAPVLDELYCVFAQGPLWIQIELQREIEGWAMNKPENRIFS